MADKKISALNPDSLPTSGDYFPTVDAETLTTKRVLLSTLVTFLFNQLNQGGGNGSVVTRALDYQYNYVVSGGFWSGDAYASTRNASMGAIIVVINGLRISIPAVTSRSFTASKDTYVDVLSNGDGTGTLVYTEVTNNAASPALASSSIRIATIVTGATNIAGSTSIGQGGFKNTVPVISSQILRGNDSLGNIIFPKGPESPSRTQNPYLASVYRNAALNSAANFSKVALDTRLYDHGNVFDVVTNNRFTCTEAGFYHFDGGASTGAGSQLWIVSLYKNGTEVSRGTKGQGTGSGVGSSVSDTIQLSIGDYIELWTYSTTILAMEVGSVAPHPQMSLFFVSSS